MKPPGRHWQAKDGLHVDTCGLAPPEPMVAILWHLEQPGQNGPVIVHLDRDPIYLYPELAGRGWSARRRSRAGSEETCLELTRTP